ncbi:MAG: endonuclease domain-containing protein [Gammaproteobacteria bacterium]|jgi:very-short-patch-repair endonuclease
MKGQTNKHILGNKLQRGLRHNMTDAEQRLWRHLRNAQMHGLKFRRQHPFGDYILDFVCLEARLIIEVDGGQHAGQEKGDDRRTAVLEKAGFRVLRFWNHEVMQDLDAVKEAIWLELRTPSPSRPPP